MVLIEFAMTPTGAGQSLSAPVARVLDVIDRGGLAYQLTPMGTIVEGEFDAVMAVVRECFRVLEPDFERIGMTLKMDHRRGDDSRLRTKVDAVERQLGRSLKT